MTCPWSPRARRGGLHSATRVLKTCARSRPPVSKDLALRQVWQGRAPFRGARFSRRQHISTHAWPSRSPGARGRSWQRRFLFRPLSRSACRGGIGGVDSRRISIAWQLSECNGRPAARAHEPGGAGFSVNGERVTPERGERRSEHRSGSMSRPSTGLLPTARKVRLTWRACRGRARAGCRQRGCGACRSACRMTPADAPYPAPDPPRSLPGTASWAHWGRKLCGPGRDGGPRRSSRASCPSF